MVSKLKTIKNRIYNDYFMGKRYNTYEELLVLLKDNGFEFITIKEAAKTDFTKKRCVILRHDVDSEPEVAQKLCEIELKYGIKSTYYFLRKTKDISIMHDMIKSGVEVGYHYEELSDYAKRFKINKPSETLDHLEQIRADFSYNFEKFQDELGYKIDTIAAHGDWKCRALDLSNVEFITKELLEKHDIVCEAYSIEDNLDFRVADRMYPVFWYPQDPVIPICKPDTKSGLILVHPRQWCSNPAKRFQEDFVRAFEGVSALI